MLNLGNCAGLMRERSLGSVMAPPAAEARLSPSPKTGTWVPEDLGAVSDRAIHAGMRSSKLGAVAFSH